VGGWPHETRRAARKFTIESILALFGANARLVAAYVEITSDPIMIDVGRKLPWCESLKRRLAVIEAASSFSSHQILVCRSLISA